MILVRITERKRSIGKAKYLCEDNIKTDLREIDGAI
jgi:hypothetical protein